MKKNVEIILEISLEGIQKNMKMENSMNDENEEQEKRRKIMKKRLTSIPPTIITAKCSSVVHVKGHSKKCPDLKGVEHKQKF